MHDRLMPHMATVTTATAAFIPVVLMYADAMALQASFLRKKEQPICGYTDYGFPRRIQAMTQR